MSEGATGEGLPALIAAMEGGDEVARLALPESWLQGRTAFGGVSTALALAAVLRRWDDLPPLRSAQVAFVGPLHGALEIRTALLRRGRSAAFVQADVAAAGALGLRATFVFMHARESHVDLAPPRLDPAAVPQLGDVASAPRHIAFARHFDLRRAGEKTPRARIRRWARLRARDGLDRAVELMAIGDVLPPAAMTLFTQAGPVSSLSWQVNLLGAAPDTRDGWWLVEAQADNAQAGSSAQQMWVRDAAGTLVATGCQSIGLFV